MPKLIVSFAPSKTLYAIVQNASGQYLNAGTYENYNSANWGSYATALTETPAGVYTADVPAGAGGTYSFLVCLQAGGSPATSDLKVGGSSVEDIAGDVQTGMTAQGFTSTRAGYLDTLNGLVAAIWASGSRTLTSFGTLVADTAAAVWTYGTRTLTSFGFTVVSDVETALTAQGYTTGRAVKLDHLDRDVSLTLLESHYVAPDNADIATILSDVSAILAKVYGGPITVSYPVYTDGKFEVDKGADYKVADGTQIILSFSGFPDITGASRVALIDPRTEEAYPFTGAIHTSGNGAPQVLYVTLGRDDLDAKDPGSYDYAVRIVLNGDHMPPPVISKFTIRPAVPDEEDV